MVGNATGHFQRSFESFNGNIDAAPLSALFQWLRHGDALPE